MTWTSISCGPRAPQAGQYYLLPCHLLKDRNGERRETAEAQQYLSPAEVRPWVGYYQISAPWEDFTSTMPKNYQLHQVWHYLGCPTLPELPYAASDWGRLQILAGTRIGTKGTRCQCQDWGEAYQGARTMQISWYMHDFTPRIEGKKEI